MNIMKSVFYDFIKVDKNIDKKNIDFSGKKSISASARLDFLKNYSEFLDNKNNTEELSYKVVSQQEVDACYKEINYKVLPSFRNRINFNEMESYLETYNSMYDGWTFYAGAKVKDNIVILNDKKNPPISCAKFEFSNDNIIKDVSFDVFIPKNYVSDSEKKGFYEKPLTTTTGRIIEFRNDISEIIKLQMYPNGDFCARVGVEDPYHHKDIKIGNIVFDDWNTIKITFNNGYFSLLLNNSIMVENIQLTNNLSINTFFISGGMHAKGTWKVRLKEFVFADGFIKKDFFVRNKQKNIKTNKKTVSLPYVVGTNLNKDKTLVLSSSFNYIDGLALLNVASIDPCGEIYVNNKKVKKVNDFSWNKMDITEYLHKGENVIKIKVFPRAPEVNYSWHRHKDPYIGWFCREVFVDIVNKNHIENLKVFTKKIEQDYVCANIFFDLTDKNKSKFNIYIKKSNSNEKEVLVCSGVCSKQFDKLVKIKALTWDYDNPILYTIRVELIENDVVIDDEVVETGFRIIEQKNGEIHLNGKRINLYGALLMQFLPPYNEIILNHVCPSTEQIIWQFLMLKKMNGNTVRFHMLGYGSNDPRYATICDRMGLMNIWTTRLIDSVENISIKNGWQEGDMYVRQVEEVINHPSIIMWEGSNEFHANKYNLDILFDEFVDKISKVDTSRLLCPSSHVYYGGGIYGNNGFYFQDDGEKDQDFNDIQSSYGWKDKLVVRSSHNYELLLGYGNKWDTFKKQAWKTQKSLFNSKKHAYIISEFAVIGRQDIRTKECAEYLKTDSYELGDEKRAFGEIYDKIDFKLSQAYQALCAYNTVKYMRYLNTDGLLWCCLSGGANDASYLKSPIDFYGYAKQAFYSLKEGFNNTICFNKSVDLFSKGDFNFKPVISGCEKGKKYNISIEIYDNNETLVFEKKYKNISSNKYNFVFDNFNYHFEKDGYYSIKYIVE